MVRKLMGEWHNTSPMNGISYTCGYCNSYVGPTERYHSKDYLGKQEYGSIYLCPSCNYPTFFNYGVQIPRVKMGRGVEYLPSDIENLYNEARNCFSVDAFTSAVLSCRKLLMNISVTKGAETGKNFAFYVDYLEKRNYIPPDSKDWVNHIRKKGNEATHEIPSISKEDAEELIGFIEMLLIIVFEMPGRMTKHKASD